MGYTTDFEGRFTVTPPLTVEHACYLARFSGTRRMSRDEGKAKGLPDPYREAVGLPVGAHGAFFTGGAGAAGQGGDESVVSHNGPPTRQPGLWCQWVPQTESGESLCLSGWSEDEGPEEGAVYTHFGWDGGEKFYNYQEWLAYLLENFLEPWGYRLDGEVTWQGEERSDVGKIVVNNNEVAIKSGHIEWE